MSSLNGEIVVADQSIGNSLQLRIFGDEFYARRETLNGYTVIYDNQQKQYCYATLTVGRFVSSGIPVYKPAPVNLRKHLKETPDVRNEKFSMRHSCLRNHQHENESSQMRTLGTEQGLLTGRKLHKGNIKGLTVLVEFDDIRSSITTNDVDEMFNSNSYTENGNYCSVKTYFETMSSGKLIYTNLVVGPIRLSKRRSHYINNLFVREVMDIVVNDLNIDLTQFDSKNEGVVDAINFLYSGESQYDGELWPHNSVVNLSYGNMRTHFYQLVGLGMHKVDLRIGTICHENGHLLCRFPDMYDYGKRDGDHEKSQGIGRYCLMGSGNHINQRRTPSPICGYLRELVGWIDSVTELDSPGSYNVEHGQYNKLMKYRTDKANEYFIIENRSSLGMDIHLPSNGLAVLHCDTLGSNEWQDGTRNKHYQCALIQADGHLDLENNRNAGDDSDMFKSFEGIALSNTTTPSSREWDGTDSGLQIRDISKPHQTIHFSVGTVAAENTVFVETWPNQIIPDNDSKGISNILQVSSTGSIASILVSIKIIHSWISDLKVTLKSPTGSSIVLHDNEGNDGDDITRTYTADDFPELQRLHDEEAGGDWTLHITDTASADIGRLLYWNLEMEINEQSGGVIEDQVEPKLAIPDNNSTGIVSKLPQTQKGTVKDIAINLNIEHTYIGDLLVELVSPSGLSALLHNREGDWRNNIARAYDVANTPSLSVFAGESIVGDWRLQVRDLARVDQGQLNSWSLTIWY